jgi:RNA polymerase sigma-70 factor (ECF subfamily)
MLLVPQKSKNEEIKELILLIKSDKKDALKELFNITKKDVFTYSLSILKNKEDAEEITQDTFITIYNSSVGYEAKGNAMMWILKIARNLCLMKLRRERKKLNVDDDFFNNLCSANLEFEEQITLKTALEILEDDEMQIIYLHIVAGFKHREIAKMMNIPLSTTLSKHHRALQKLKKEIMKGEGNE